MGGRKADSAQASPDQSAKEHKGHMLLTNQDLCPVFEEKINS